MSEDGITAVDALVKECAGILRNLGDEITESDELSANVTVEGLSLIEKMGWRLAEQVEKRGEVWRGWLERMGERAYSTDLTEDDEEEVS